MWIDKYLGSTCNHVPNKTSIIWSISEDNMICFSLKVVRWNMEADTTFSSTSLYSIHNPCIFWATFAYLKIIENISLTKSYQTKKYLSSFFFVSVSSSLIDSTAFPHEMTTTSQFARINMTKDDNINTCLFFAHFSASKLCWSSLKRIFTIKRISLHMWRKNKILVQFILTSIIRRILWHVITKYYSWWWQILKLHWIN
jgi:hypothetical protein